MSTPAPLTTTVQLTTNPGLEDVVELELRHAGLAEDIVLRPGGRQGHVQAEVTALGPVLAMRSIHHVLQPLDRYQLDGDPLAQARTRAAALSWDWLDGSFRVTCRRRGTHSFGSPDIERAAGAGIVAACAAPVDLNGFQHQVRVEVVDDQVTVWRQLTRRRLSRRPVGPYRQRVALSSNVAFAMWALTLGLDAAPTAIADPCCGTGTLLLEAGVMYPQARLLGGDRHPPAAAGSRDNLAAAGLADRAEITQADARALATTWGPQALDAIVTNPPFGMRLGERIDFAEWYRALLLAAAGSLRQGGRLTLLALKRNALNRALRDVGGLRTVHTRVIETGGIWPGLFVLERG